MAKSFSSAFVIIDALDECQSAERGKVLDMIGELNSVSVRIFATSRPHLRDVENFFGNASRIIIEADTEDLKRYLIKHVSEKIPEYGKLKDDIVDALSVKSNGLYVFQLFDSLPMLTHRNRFLLCTAQLHYVLRFKIKAKMKKALNESIPTDLFNLYDVAMSRITQLSDDSTELAINVMSWIFYAARPLQMSELQQAIAIENAMTDLTLDDVTPADIILESCASLVRHDKVSGVVRFSHDTVREYLAERCFDQLRTKLVMAKNCLTYLSFNIFEEGACPDDDAFNNRRQNYPFGQYAASFWGKYVQGKGEQDTEILELLLALMRSPTKVDSMAQFLTGSMVKWNLSMPWMRGKALIHIIVENDLRDMANALLTTPSKVFPQFSEFIDT